MSGAGADGGSSYRGTATLSATGRGTWSMRWSIGSDSYSGTGVGDGQMIAISFGGSGGSGTALYRLNPDGSYSGMWAFGTDRALRTETLVPMR